MLLIVWGYSNTGTGKSALTSLWTFFTSAETKRLFCFFASSSYIFHLFNSLIRMRARAMIQTCGEDDEDVGGIIKSLASLKPSGLKINRLWVWNININKNNIFRPFSQSLFVYIYILYYVSFTSCGVFVLVLLKVIQSLMEILLDIFKKR